jgi:nanoRNase/pAp phosphatase (c-di-AMP/oligoRNAs hydrolase)
MEEGTTEPPPSFYFYNKTANNNDRSLPQMLNDVISRLIGSDKLILVHGNADPDALGSAFALSRAFPPADILPVEGLEPHIEERIGQFGHGTSHPQGKDYPLIVVLDTSSPEQLGPYADIRGEIDHNRPSLTHQQMAERGTFICDEEKRSCAEVVARYLDRAEIPVSKEMALGLCAGDPHGHWTFPFSNADSLRTFARLIDDAGVSVRGRSGIDRFTTDISERVARDEGGAAPCASRGWEST